MHSNKVVIIIPRERLLRKDMRDIVRCYTCVRRAILKNGFSAVTVGITKKDFLTRGLIKKKIAVFNPCCIFNLFEGFSGDAQKEVDFVEILEEIKIPFSGNGSRTLNACLDKSAAKRIMARRGIAVPAGLHIKALGDLKPELLRYPVFVKPAREDASLGIDDNSLVASKKHLPAIVKDKLRQFSDGVIVEEFLWGKEYSVGFLGNWPYELLGISVIDYSRYKGLPPFLTYNSKWNRQSLEFKKIMPSLKENIDKNIKNRIISLSREAAKALNCRSYFRVDLRQKDNELFVLDVNPNPDINRDSGFMKQAYSKGYGYNQVIGKIIGSLFLPR